MGLTKRRLRSPKTMGLTKRRLRSPTKCGWQQMVRLLTGKMVTMAK